MLSEGTRHEVYMRRVVVVILDGLRRDFVDAARTPHLAEFVARAEQFPAYRTAFPSATRVVTATFATGCHPARHTLQGNSMALLEDGVLVPHDAGAPDFLQHKRAVNGYALAVPTLAERLAPHGGAIVYNNVSPGAAYAHDPDGYGHVYHRAGSFGPGRAPGEPLNVTLDAAGDRAMTERFVADALGARHPALAVLWLGEPDHIQHNATLGSPEHLAVLREADRNACTVIDAVDRRRRAGDDVLLIVGSDHGHETVSGVVDIEAELIAAGLKSAPEFERHRRHVERHIDADLPARRSGTSPRSAWRIPRSANMGRQSGRCGQPRDDRAGIAQWPRIRRLAEGGCIGERIRRPRTVACCKATLGQAGPPRLRPAWRFRSISSSHRCC